MPLHRRPVRQAGSFPIAPARGSASLRLLLAAATILVVPGEVLAEPGVATVSQRRDYPFNCRGGAQLVFDTLTPPSGTGRVSLVLSFVPGPSAAGPEGQGLPPSTCAWVDRPVNGQEPLRLRVTITDSDTTPRASVRDTGVYWSFLAHNSDSGYLSAAGYRHWHASSPPHPAEAIAPSAAPDAGRQLEFDPRYLPVYALVWVLIAWVPMMVLTGRWSGWRRLARLYPSAHPGAGRSFGSGSMVMGRSTYRGGVRLTADAAHLHFFAGALFRPGHPPFSVPWPDLGLTPAEWPWFPLRGHPMIRLTLARYPGLRILVSVSTGERIAAASGGRVRIERPPAPPPPFPARSGVRERPAPTHTIKAEI
jgi:hypothetical protein